MQYRIWRSPHSRFGGISSEFPDEQTDETFTALDVYTEEELSLIARHGFNAVWIHAQLAHIAQTAVFPELGTLAMMHIEKLSRLLERAERHGIKIFLYCQPLRSIPESHRFFWEKHPECAGQIEYSWEEVSGEPSMQKFKTISLCSSVPSVKQFVESAATFLAEKLPRLGGIILITATEFPGHCYQRRTKRTPYPCYPLIECPRCRNREPWEVAAELIALVRNGIRRISEDISVIAWNWSWTLWSPAPCEELLHLLPNDVIVMADFERGGTVDLPERPDFEIDEYSLLYPGPSQSFRHTFDACGKLGFKRMAKLQLGTTHELGSVVSIPDMISIREKALWFQNHPDTGYMGCWNFGNFFSANVDAFLYFQQNASLIPEEDLKAFASSYFPGCDAALMFHAWDLFHRAIQHLPFCIGPLYYGVHTYALAYSEIYHPAALKHTPTGCSYLPASERGDDLSPACEMLHHEFSLTELIGAYAKTAAIWDAGVSLMTAALKACPDTPELGNAVICGACWRSTENAFRAYALRKDWNNEKKIELLHIIRSELEVLNFVLPYLKQDERQGFHGEAGVPMFSADSVQAKMKILLQIQSAL